MIVPMKKVTLIVLSQKRSDTLKKLRRLGLMHIEITEGSGARVLELQEQISELERCVSSLGKPESGQDVQKKELSPEEALAISRDLSSLLLERQACQADQAASQAELARLEPWGNIDPEAIRECAKQGINFSLYEIPVSEYQRLDESLKTLCLERTKSSVKCLLFNTEDQENEALSKLSAYRFPLPQMSTQELRQKAADMENRIRAIDKKIAGYTHQICGIQSAIRLLEKELQFEVYSTGMDEEALSSKGAGGVKVSYFQGYIEAENLDKLKVAAKDNAWGLLAEDPTEEDNAPTKLKNNRFVSLIYPITDFLGTVPGYFEFDISGWFLLFILLFFGIIFGDGGYGLIICAVAAVPTVKSLASKKAMPPTILLLWLFGLSTVLWGTLTCTWFGLAADQLPKWLQSLSIPVISNVYTDRIWYPFGIDGGGLTTSQNLQIVCFSLALVQLSIAHLICAVRDRRSLKVLGDIGSVIQLFGIFYVVLSLVVNSQVFPFGLVVSGVPVGTVAIILVLAGFLMSFIFSNYEGHIGKSIKASLVNIVSVLLGVVNVFSDIVSYIRLWAVGLAGSAISATVNELAGPLLGNFMFMVFAIIILIFGHGLNMILNVLSVIVHGIRLNTLEFSSHLDMSWSGHKFQPFKE